MHVLYSVLQYNKWFLLALRNIKLSFLLYFFFQVKKVRVLMRLDDRFSSFYYNCNKGIDDKNFLSHLDKDVGTSCINVP